MKFLQCLVEVLYQVLSNFSSNVCLDMMELPVRRYSYISSHGVANFIFNNDLEGSLTLVGGDPGIGKSTLLLQISAMIANKCSDDETPPVVYVSGEESLKQICARADRLGIKSNIYLYSSTDIEDILRKTHGLSPCALVVDSIQTVYLNTVIGSAGGITQVKECTAALMRFAKTTNISVILIGHVTKSGEIAGPRVLEHIVDAVLYMEVVSCWHHVIIHAQDQTFGVWINMGGPDNKFRDKTSNSLPNFPTQSCNYLYKLHPPLPTAKAINGEKHSPYRMLRAVKNRFGSTDELAVLEMSQSGLQVVSNASEMFLTQQHSDSNVLAGLAIAVLMDGTRTFLVEIQFTLKLDVFVTILSIKGVMVGQGKGLHTNSIIRFEVLFVLEPGVFVIEKHLGLSEYALQLRAKGSFVVANLAINLRVVRETFPWTKELSAYSFQSYLTSIISRGSDLSLEKAARPLYSAVSPYRITSIVTIEKRDFQLTSERNNFVVGGFWALKVLVVAVFLNVVGGFQVTETAGDLAIAAAICSSFLEFPIPEGTAFIGEIGLGGELRMVPRIDKRVNTVAKLGYRMCVVPKQAEKLLETEGLEGIKVVGCKDLKEVINTVFSKVTVN
ncbi:hypothetical protein V8G54_025508 [Vigna mungo]|uniref:RecA family profile 1 domain-containing protein n=1 Tax=Vigna mungo TaxID=3915 RepID=A0AAQ3RL74_VIGMU